MNIKVTCAIIVFEKKVLLTQRSEKMDLPLKWEFPGGKVEEGEDETDCIKREILEELNLEIDIIQRLTSVVHHYKHKTIELIPFIAKKKSGNIVLSEHNDYKLLTVEELSEIDLAEADKKIIKNNRKSIPGT